MIVLQSLQTWLAARTCWLFSKLELDDDGGLICVVLEMPMVRCSSMVKLVWKPSDEKVCTVHIGAVTVA